MPSSTPDTFTTNCQGFRNDIAAICTDLDAFSRTAANPEEIANLTLAFRHLEDAAMRIGKAIQAHSGGVSPLGGPVTRGALSTDSTTASEPQNTAAPADTAAEPASTDAPAGDLPTAPEQQ